MSGYTNEGITFKEIDKYNYVEYQSNYKDENGNRWVIHIAGKQKIVNSFLETRPIKLYAEAYQASEEMRRSAQILAPQNKKDKAEDLEDESYDYVQPTDFAIRIELKKLAVSRPYRVVYEFDPPINAKSKGGPHDFILIGTDSQANVDFTNNGSGIVLKVVLGQITDAGVQKFDKKKDQMGTVMANTVVETNWRIKVKNKSDFNGEYNLTGDIIVN